MCFGANQLSFGRLETARRRLEILISSECQIFVENCRLASLLANSGKLLSLCKKAIFRPSKTLKIISIANRRASRSVKVLHPKKPKAYIMENTISADDVYETPKWR